MALTAFGFTGTVEEVAWAKMARSNGTPYSVGGDTDFAVQTVVGLDRTIRVLPGSAFGHGVLVDNDANINVQLDTISSGVRWDTIVLRRTWGTGTVAVTKVNGTSARAIATGLNSNPGTGIDDQPLALVQVTAGATAPTAIDDLRLTGVKVLTAATTLALPTDNGTFGVVGGDIYHRAGGAWSRFRGDLPEIQIPGSSGQWAVTGSFVEARGGNVTVQLDARRVSSPITSATNLNTVCTLPEAYRPSRLRRAPFFVIGSPRTERPAEVRFETDGGVILVGAIDVDGRVQGSITWPQR